MNDLIYVIFTSSIRMAIPLILAATGGAFSVRAGISDLGLEGMMLAGASFGVLGSYLTGNRWWGLVIGVLFGVIFSLFHAILHITFKVNAAISGVSLNLLAGAVAPLMLQLVWNTKGFSVPVDSFKYIKVEWVKNIPIVGRVLSEQNIIFFIAMIIVIVAWIYLYKTASGLRLRMVGENPVAASTVGIKTRSYKYFGVMMSGALAGLGGVYLSMGHLDTFVNGMTAGRGFLALVINSLGRYNPLLILIGSVFFGFFDALQNILQSDAIPSQLLRMLPYVVTLITITFGTRRSKPPMGMGKHYDD